MRRAITRALNLSRQRREARTVTLICLGLLISLSCFSAEIFTPKTDKILLTTTVVWEGFTNVSQLKPIGVVSSNELPRTFTNAPQFQPATWFQWQRMILPKTNSTKLSRLNASPSSHVAVTDSNVVVHLHTTTLREVGTP